MAKLENIEDVRIIDLVSSLIKEKITKDWLKEILSAKRFQASHFGRDFSMPEFFDICIWDNLSEEQQKKVTEELNLLLEEDLYKSLIHRDSCGYLQNLVTIACIVGAKIPRSINSEFLLKWRKEEFPNLTKPKDKTNPLIEEFTQKIESAFGKNQ